MTLVEQFERGLDAPICLTWELTYACNLSCVHCLSSSGRRDPPSRVWLPGFSLQATHAHFRLHSRARR